MKKLSLIVLLSSLGISQASWSVHVEDDIFAGKKAMLVGTLSSNEALVFDCQKDKPPRMALIFPDKTSEFDYPVNVQLLIKIDDNDIIKGSASAGRRNQEYGEFSYSGNNEFQILKELRDARKQFLIGIQANSDNKSSISGDVVRSTSSINSFIEACNLNL